MTVEDNAHFIIWNERGDECQRLYLHDIDLNLRYNFEFGNVEYSPYHMSAYSFEDDLMVFGGPFDFLTIIPMNKKDSYLAGVQLSNVYDLISINFMGNASRIWLLGIAVNWLGRG